MIDRVLIATVALTLAAAVLAAPPPQPGGTPVKHLNDSCLRCHGKLDDRRLRAPAEEARSGIHQTQGVSCAGCHGGDPASDDSAVAMSAARGFKGKLAATAIPEMCGSCHSNAAYMLRYAPNIPTDQLPQYRTSKHGKALATGDTNVAVCTSCHGTHGILPPSDARSPVYPTRIVETCGRCHGDAGLMSRYGIKGNEVTEYKRSVHYAALVTRNDLSAPTCKSCHGAHGATPPGISSVANVCGTCHLSQRERFDLSPHKDAFAALEQPACESCHSNHAIVHPQDSWIGMGDKQLCGSCHSAGDAGAIAANSIGSALAKAASADATTLARVQRVERAGMLMDEADVKLEDAHQATVMAELEIHTANVGRVESQTKAALAALAAADTLAADAEKEIRYRRTGLFVSLLVIAFAMVLLIFKIRAMER